MQDAVFHNFQIHVFLISLYLFYITVNIGRGIYNLDFRLSIMFIKHFRIGKDEQIMD